MTDSLGRIPTFPFPLEIIQSKRKTLAISVKSGNVIARCPYNYPEKWVFSFIQQKINWINKQLRTQKLKSRQKLVIADKHIVHFFGQPRTIQVIISSKQHVELSQEQLTIYSRHNTAPNLERLFNRWLLSQAREYMTTQTIKAARRLGVEHKFNKVVFRKTKTKWGHCCHDGTIQYNWLTMMAPQPVVDYLIAHESSHLVHMNHSKQFWATVARICPEYKELKGWLAANGHRLWTETIS